MFIEGRMRTLEECTTPEQEAMYWLKYDKIMEEARDVLDELNTHNNGEGL